MAVGDAEFQRRCLGKIGEFTERGGRTVLFVSHQLATVGLLCSNAVLLRGGRIATAGATAKVIAEYTSSISANSPRHIVGNKTGPVMLTGILLHGTDNTTRNTFDLDEDFYVSIQFHALETFQALRVGLRITSPEYGTIITTTDADSGEVPQRRPGEYRLAAASREIFSVPVSIICRWPPTFRWSASCSMK